jgi:hypothetical protein
MDPILKHWTTENFETSTFQQNLNFRKNAVHKKMGADQTGKNTYTYNELGFRGDSITKEGFKVMSIGCSITEGVGVSDNETWPSQFCKLIPNSVNMNFGTEARSNDFIARCLLTYFDLIKPDLVLILYTFTHRREVYTKENYVEPYIPAWNWGYLRDRKEGVDIHNQMNQLQNDNSDIINWYKNHLLIKYFLESKKCNWIWNGSCLRPSTRDGSAGPSVSLSYDYPEFNRFDADNGYSSRSLYKDIGRDNDHPGPLHHRIYAKQLYNHILSHHKNYLKL